MNNDFEKLLIETTKLNVSALASEKKKKAYIEDMKDKFDTKLERICERYAINHIQCIDKEQCWKEAIVYADSQFEIGPQRLKVNGFYVQELFHKYVEMCIERVS